jgi:predicted molibdopterin-dependent oxidoreductase YjgC
MKLNIDGKRVEAEGKKTILDVARENGIYIPALCDHPKLEPFGGCRLCIVEVQGRRGFAPSCSTYAEDGMEVKSDSPKIREMRKDILGLILTEHPDACLVCAEKQNCDDYKSTIRKVGEVTGCVLCPNNGRCDLQDVVKAVQIEKVDFPSVYRDFEIRKNDPFFDRNYNLCILCGRCVRVCHELRGASTVHFINRGSEAVIGTSLDRPLHESGCQFCGACVDVCPTGALTERAVKYDPLPESSSKTICPFCSMGCEMETGLHEGRILYVKPSEKGAVNKGQACVKGRFLTRDVVYSAQRILRPMIRRKKELEEVTWEEALDFVAQKIAKFKGNEVGMIHSPQLGCEDQFIADKVARDAMKTKNIAATAVFTPLDSLAQLSKKNGIKPSYRFKKEDISRAEVIFLTGTELAISHPILWLEVLKAVRRGAKLVVVSPVDQTGNRHASVWLPIKQGSEDLLFQVLAKLVLKRGKAGGQNFEGFMSFRRALNKLDMSKVSGEIGIDEQTLSDAADVLMQGKICIIAGMELTQISRESGSMAALWNLSLLCESQLIPLGMESSNRGIFELGRKESRGAKLLTEIVQDAQGGKIKALYVIGPVPFDEKVKPEFLVVQDSFFCDAVERADAVLPATTFAETDGTVVNVEGKVQKFVKVIRPLGESKPDWWILSQLGKKLKKAGFEYKKSQDILKELKKAVPGFAQKKTADLEKGKNKYLPLKSREPASKNDKRYPYILSLSHNRDFYRNLVFSREIKGFEKVRNFRWIWLNPGDAKSLKLKNGDRIILESPEMKLKGVAKISEAVPRRMVKASFLWSDGLDISSSVLPVKVKRGK